MAICGASFVNAEAQRIQAQRTRRRIIPPETKTERSAATSSMYALLPSVHELASAVELADSIERFSRPTVIEAVRAVIQQQRHAMQSGDLEPVSRELLLQRVQAHLRVSERPPLCEAINGTGILLHTGLGRAPLSEAAIEAVREACCGYTPLEIDLATGRRGQRSTCVQELLCELTGAESGLVVNNNAAALLLALGTLAKDKQVIVSRGELIEIGGNFRLPEIMSASGAQLVEVGTTNKTRLSDYQAAIGPSTGALLKVHPSNYQLSGFTAEVGIEQLAALGRKAQLPVMHDIGSGALFDPAMLGLPSSAAHGEPVARVSIDSGADVVMFSGDKLLGGPQAGILVGRRELIERMAANPLARALRVDKMALAALWSTLVALRTPERAARELPLWQMAAEGLEQLADRGQAIAAQLDNELLQVDLVEVTSYLGGGTLPSRGLPSLALALRSERWSSQQLSERLRTGRPPVVGRLHKGQLLIDLRSVLPGQDRRLAEAIAAAGAQV